MRAGEALFAAGSALSCVAASYATYMQRSEETGLFGPLTVAAAQPLCPELRQFCHCFQSALAGAATDWRLWLGKGPGLTPSHDDTLTGMLLAAWYFGAIDERAGRNFCPIRQP